MAAKINRKKILFWLTGFAANIAATLIWRKLLKKIARTQNKTNMPNTGANLLQTPKATHTAQEVGEFYNQTNDKFLKVYGNVIQAYRTTNVNDLLNYQIDAMQLQKGMHVLDAGCGVCGPAIYFAQQTGVRVDALTISEVQVQKAMENIQDAGLADLVRVKQGDYHLLPQLYPPDSFDVVYFLESFGHSPNHALAIASTWKVLKPGGLLYIKDLFQKEALLPEHEAKIAREVKKINEGYCYNIANLYEVLHVLRKTGFVISALKTIDLSLKDFENLTISNDFQEMFNIARIESWEDYIFPIDFFELKCYKPVYQLQHGTDKYFLQNLYYMQVHGKRQEEL